MAIGRLSAKLHGCGFGIGALRTLERALIVVYLFTSLNVRKQHRQSARGTSPVAYWRLQLDKFTGLRHGALSLPALPPGNQASVVEVLRRVQRPMIAVPSFQNIVRAVSLWLESTDWIQGHTTCAGLSSAPKLLPGGLPLLGGKWQSVD